MTLAELLALLPDNTTGEITPADLRAVVSGLHQLATLQGTSFAFKWTDDQSPPTGRVAMDAPWQLSATKTFVNETTDDGVILTFGLVDAAVAGKVSYRTADNSKLTANILGPSVDLGEYREIPIHVESTAGPAPSNGELVTVTFITVME